MMKDLFNTLPQTGTVQWIGLRPEREAEVIEVEYVHADRNKGLEGDRYSGKSGNRQVTLIQSEHLHAVASMLEKESLDPSLLRRNIVVSGINLLALKEKQFQIGAEVILETTGHCHPCSKMEKLLGPGGYNAMRGHGGITARVIREGTIKKGDKVQMLA